MSTSAVDPKSMKTFAEFYPFYLSEHSNRTCRRLHFVGSTLALVGGSRLVESVAEELFGRGAPNVAGRFLYLIGTASLLNKCGEATALEG